MFHKPQNLFLSFIYMKILLIFLRTACKTVRNVLSSGKEVIHMQQDPIIVTDINHVKRDTIRPGQFYIPVKPRDFHAIAYITEGNLRYQRESTSVELNTHEIILIQKGCVDLAECVGNMPVSYITVDFHAFAESFDWPTRFSPGERSVDLFESFSRILELYTQRGIGWKMDCIEQLYSILNELRRLGDNNAYQYRRIAPAMRLLDECLGDPALTVSSLAASCGMSAGSLNRIVHALYGCTTSALIQTRRMENACALLHNSANSITEIAARCGYSDIYSFSHAFRRAFGVPPTDWRG